MIAQGFEQEEAEATERFSLLPPLAPVIFGAARWGVSFRVFRVFRGATVFNAETREAARFRVQRFRGSRFRVKLIPDQGWESLRLRAFALKPFFNAETERRRERHSFYIR